MIARSGGPPPSEQSLMDKLTWAEHFKIYPPDCVVMGKLIRYFLYFFGSLSREKVNIITPFAEIPNIYDVNKLTEEKEHTPQQLDDDPLVDLVLRAQS